MQNYDWPVRFREIYDAAVQRYSSGNRKADSLFTPEETAFLASIGCRPQELFDFVEDYVRGDEPVFESVLLVTAARRDYFLHVQNGKWSDVLIDMDKLPPKNAELAGIRWLPRIIEKARAKLRGEMPADLMYGCGGDRPFLRSVNVELADFLRVTWSAGEATDKIIDYVLRCRDAAQRR
jgi:hypothetical protein